MIISEEDMESILQMYEVATWEGQETDNMIKLVENIKNEKKIKVKKVSFRVRRIYYDQFVAGTKHEELRALKLYWVKILHPFVPLEYSAHPEVKAIDKMEGVGFWNRNHQPKIAVISTPGQPTLSFKISSILIGEPELILNRKLSEDGKKDIPTELCIVTKMGERITKERGEKL